jgi:hypothetical protein
VEVEVGGGSASSGSPTPSSHTVSVQQLSGAGRALVDQSGKPIYTSDQEASGKIVCDDACNAFWKPVTSAAGMPTAAPGTGKLGVIKRPDGAMLNRRLRLLIARSNEVGAGGTIVAPRQVQGATTEEEGPSMNTAEQARSS